MTLADSAKGKEERRKSSAALKIRSDLPLQIPFLAAASTVVAKLQRLFNVRGTFLAKSCTIKFHRVALRVAVLPTLNILVIGCCVLRHRLSIL
jgi:hypothetical protein